VTGQGFGHVQYSFAAHRAVVEVDTELGLVKVVELACAQDVGQALNPPSVVGQIQGSIVQGLGLAVMEEIVVSRDGRVRNPSFTGYLIPTVRHSGHPGRPPGTGRRQRAVRPAQRERSADPVRRSGRDRGHPRGDRAAPSPRTGAA
jgi:hypothetical protein